MNGEETLFPYEDIVNLPHPVSKRHPQMPLAKRAVQFGPFAALVGHGDAIAEAARLTDSRSDMAAERLQELSRRLAYVMSLPGHPVVDITYFRPDGRKSGGEYVTVQGSIKRVEPVYNLLKLTDGTEIPLDAVTDLDGDLFTDYVSCLFSE